MQTFIIYLYGDKVDSFEGKESDILDRKKEIASQHEDVGIYDLAAFKPSDSKAIREYKRSERDTKVSPQIAKRFNLS